MQRTAWRTSEMAWDVGSPKGGISCTGFPAAATTVVVIPSNAYGRQLWRGDATNSNGVVLKMYR